MYRILATPAQTLLVVQDTFQIKNISLPHPVLPVIHVGKIPHSAFLTGIRELWKQTHNSMKPTLGSME